MYGITPETVFAVKVKFVGTLKKLAFPPAKKPILPVDVPVTATTSPTEIFGPATVTGETPVICPSVTDIVPSELRTDRYVTAYPPDANTETDTAPVKGMEVVWAKLGRAEIALTPIALKRENNRVVGFMFLVVW